MKKILKSRLFIFILGGLIFGSIGVYAATLYTANQISYEGADGSTNVKDALDDLFDKTENIQNNPTITGLYLTSTYVAPTYAYLKLSLNKKFTKVTVNIKSGVRFYLEADGVLQTPTTSTCSQVYPNNFTAGTGISEYDVTNVENIIISTYNDYQTGTQGLPDIELIWE